MMGTWLSDITFSKKWRSKEMEHLNKPPLIEALVEIKWELVDGPTGQYDPHFQFLLGVFRNHIKNKYPYHEPLPACNVPDEFSGTMIKHRFRIGKEAWPLVQIGPGVLTVNETQNYDTFETFKPQAIKVIQDLFASHPDKNSLQINSLKLRYIDAVEFDYSNENIYDFLKDKMHLETVSPSVLLKENIENLPVQYSSKTSFRCNAPPGIATFTVQTGHKSDKRAVIWNQVFQSSDSDVPNMPDGFEQWMDNAHNVISEWFKGIIEGDLEGDLEGEFNGE